MTVTLTIPDSKFHRGDLIRRNWPEHGGSLTYLIEGVHGECRLYMTNGLVTLSKLELHYRCAVQPGSINVLGTPVRPGRVNDMSVELPYGKWFKVDPDPNTPPVEGDTIHNVKIRETEWAKQQRKLKQTKGR